jgi:tRNA(Ile)-lysidine synthase
MTDVTIRDPAAAFLRAVCATLSAHPLLPRAVPASPLPPEPVLVATSGGPDSVALLHVLCALARPDAAAAFRLNILPVAAHLNHGLRGADADEDERFVQSLAARLGLECETGRADVRAMAEAEGLGLEETARRARRAFLARAARRRGARLIALGHHADDRAETVLFNILRGTGIEGLASLGPRATLLGEPSESVTRAPLAACPPGLPPTAEGLEIVRPLIGVRRDLILAYLAAKGLAYRHDASNASPEFTRNRLRGELLPLLRQAFNPKVDEALCRLADQAAAADEVLAQALDATWRALARLVPSPASGEETTPPCSLLIDADEFASLAPWMQGAILRRAVEHLGGGLKHMSAERTREVVSALLSKSFVGPISLPGGLVATRQRRAIRIENRSAE